MRETMELGPQLNLAVSNFSLPTHKDEQVSLENIIGKRGILLAFIGGIWQQSSVRRIFWLQRHAYKFTMLEIPIALIVHESIATLYGFHMSSPLSMPFPILADEKGYVHQAYQMGRHPGLLLIDKNYILREKWLMPNERVFPEVGDILQAVQRM